MNRKQLRNAREMLVVKLSNLNYDEVRHQYLDAPTAFEFRDERGRRFTAEIEARYDDPNDHGPNAPIRLLLSVDSGGLSALLPLTDSIILKPSEK